MLTYQSMLRHENESPLLTVKNSWLTKSPETIIPSRKFSEETAMAIIKSGGEIYTISGVSINTQRSFKPYLILDDTKDHHIRTQTEPAGQLAVFPDEPFVPDSFDSDYPSQAKLLNEEEKALVEKLGTDDFKLVVPSAPETTEILLKHLFKPENHFRPLYGRKKATRTTTTACTRHKVESLVTVGYINNGNGLYLYSATHGYASSQLGLLKVAKPQNRHNT